MWNLTPLCSVAFLKDLFLIGIAIKNSNFARKYIVDLNLRNTSSVRSTSEQEHNGQELDDHQLHPRLRMPVELRFYTQRKREKAHGNVYTVKEFNCNVNVRINLWDWTAENKFLRSSTSDRQESSKINMLFEWIEIWLAFEVTFIADFYTFA